jgi:DNA-binding response OmpR family regulator
VSTRSLRPPPAGTRSKPEGADIQAAPRATSPVSIAIGVIEVDIVNECVRSSGRAVRLGEIELKLLILLISEPGKIFSREWLAEVLWPKRIFLDVRTVDQKIRRLRTALNRGPAPDPIRSVRGQGYKFSENYEKDYAAWVNRGRKRYHLEEIARMQKRVKR